MARKDVSAVVSGAGFTAGFWVNLDKEVRKRGGSDEAIYEALKDGSPLVPKFAELIVEASRPKFHPLFVPVGTVTVAATTTPFVARDRFVVNTEKNAPAKISYLGNRFKEWFLEKIEKPFGGSTLNYGELSRSSVDGPIIAALGGEEKAETTLAELFSFMGARKKGESGSLLTSGYANIFYIKDVNGVLRAVYVLWDGGGWGVDALPVSDPSAWYGGSQVFSRNS